MNFVIVRTEGGQAYSGVISRSLKWIAQKKGKDINVFVVPTTEISAFMETHKELTRSNTIIHPRAAHPSEKGWMGTLFALKEKGFKIVNPPDALRLTSDKLAGALKLQAVVAHPHTWVVNNNESPNVSDGIYVVKPQTSMEQGLRVQRLCKVATGWLAFDKQNVPPQPLKTFTANLGNPFVLQEFVDYESLYRVIVINNEPLPYAFLDKPEFHPGNWKVSVCLNRETMQFVPEPDPALLVLAVEAQRTVGASISFVDVFRTRHGKYVMSEINTACNLTPHEVLARAALGESGAWNIHYRISKALWNLAFS